MLELDGEYEKKKNTTEAALLSSQQNIYRSIAVVEFSSSTGG